MRLRRPLDGLRHDTDITRVRWKNYTPGRSIPALARLV
jgi:hypothetical protein